MSDKQITRIVLATIKSKAELEDGWKVELDVPEFKSQYPTLCTRVKPEVAAQLKPGLTVRLVLEQQSLKKGKDGSFPSHYYWGLRGVATEAETVAAAQVTIPMSAWSTPASASIEAQVAYKGAIELLAASLGPALPIDGVGLTDLVKEIEFLTIAGYRAIQVAKHTGAAPGFEGQAIAELTPPSIGSPQAQQAGKTSPEALAMDTGPSGATLPGAASTSKAPSPPKNMGEVQMWAFKQGKDTGDVLAVLGKHGYMAADGTPLRAAGQIATARPQITPAEVKALCEKEWGL